MKKSLLLMFVLIAVVVIAGCSSQTTQEKQDSRNKSIKGFVLGGDNNVQEKESAIADDKFCSTDDDCACGVSTQTAECEVANRDYIQNGDEQNQDGGICKTECNGKIGQLDLKCVDNTCQIV